LLESDARYRRLLNNVAVIVFELDRAGFIVFVNDSVAQLTGYPLEDIEGHNWKDVFFSGERQALADRFIHLVRSRDVRDFELVLEAKDGKLITLEVDTANRYDENGSLERVIGLGEDITERKILESELIDSLERLRIHEEELRVQNEELEIAQAEMLKEHQRYLDLFEFAPDGYLVTDPDGVIQEANKIASELLQKEDISGIPIHNFISPRDRNHFNKVMHQLQSAQKTRGWETEIHTALNYTFPATLIVAPILADGDRLTGLRWLLHDITDRKKVEEDLRRKSAAIQLLQEIAAAANETDRVEDAFQFALERICNYLNWPLAHVYNVDPDCQDQLASTKIWCVRSTNNFEHFREITEKSNFQKDESLPGKVLRTRKPYYVVDVLHDYDFMRSEAASETGIRSAFAFPVIAGQEIVAVLEFFTQQAATPDQAILEIMHNIGTQLGRVVERKRAQEQQAYQAYLLQSLNDAVIAIDKDYVVTAWNRAAEEIYGWAAEEAVGKPSNEILGPRITEAERQKITEQLARTGEYIGELVQHSKDGMLVIVDARLTALKDGSGQVTGYVAMNRDITRRKHMEEALRQSEARFRTVFESSALGIKLIDLDGRIIETNPAFEEMIGITAEDLLGTHFTEFTYPEDTSKIEVLFDAVASGEEEEVHTERRLIRQNGSIVWVVQALSLVRDQSGKPQFVVSLVENITRQKQMQAELEEVQRRLIDSGEAERLHLAQELHDGPVQDLYGVSYRLGALKGAIQGEDLAQFMNVQDSIQQVIQMLRATSGELRPPTLAPFGLEKAIRSHAENFQLAHPEIEVHLSLMPDRKDLSERVRLVLFRIYQQALMNVFRHAQASRVDIRLSVDAEQIILEVEDNGIGFDVPNRWIRMAREGHLGLVGASERAQSIGGVLEIQSKPEEGTLVRVTVQRIVE
jgi:PAS domain S-box-containing protein